MADATNGIRREACISHPTWHGMTMVAVAGCGDADVAVHAPLPVCTLCLLSLCHVASALTQQKKIAGVELIFFSLQAPEVATDNGATTCVREQFT